MSRFYNNSIFYSYLKLNNHSLSALSNEGTLKYNASNFTFSDGSNYIHSSGIGSIGLTNNLRYPANGSNDYGKIPKLTASGWDLLPIFENNFNAYYVDSNNPESGDGSVLSPFNSIDLAFDTIFDSGNDRNPATRPTINVKGGSYTVTKNLWTNADWVFEPGCEVTKSSGGYLFDQTGLTLGYGPNCNGEIKYTYSNSAGFLKTEANETINELRTFSFASITCDGTVSAIHLQNCSYNGGGNAVNYRIIGNDNGLYANIRNNTSSEPLFKVTVQDSSKFAIYSLTNVAFLDNYSLPSANTGVLDITNMSYTTRFSNIFVNTATGSTSPREHIFKISGKYLGIGVDGLQITSVPSAGTVNAFYFDITDYNGLSPVGRMRTFIKNMNVNILNNSTGSALSNSYTFKMSDTSLTPRLKVQSIVSNVPNYESVTPLITMNDYYDSDASTFVTIENDAYINNIKDGSSYSGTTYDLVVSDTGKLLRKTYGIAGKSISSLISNPTSLDNGKAIIWDNANSQYTLSTITSGLTNALNGLTNNAGVAELGGALTKNTNVTGAFTLGLGTTASKLNSLSGVTSNNITLTSYAGIENDDTLGIILRTRPATGNNNVTDFKVYSGGLYATSSRTSPSNLGDFYVNLSGYGADGIGSINLSTSSNTSYHTFDSSTGFSTQKTVDVDITYNNDLSSSIIYDEFGVFQSANIIIGFTEYNNLVETDISASFYYNHDLILNPNKFSYFKGIIPGLTENTSDQQDLITGDSTSTWFPTYKRIKQDFVDLDKFTNNIANKPVYSTVSNPTIAENGKVITWDNINNRYTLSNTTVTTTGIIYVDIVNGTNIGYLPSPNYKLSNPFNSIQQAVDNAVSGDIIYIRPGTYTENVIIPTTANLKLTFILDRVIWNAATSSGNCLYINNSSQTINIHMMDSTISNTGNGTSTSTAQNTATIYSQCQLNITSNEQTFPHITGNTSSSITLSTSLRNGRNRIISSNSCNISGLNINIQGVYLETSGTNAYNYYGSNANMQNCMCLSILGWGVHAFSVINNSTILSKNTCLPGWCNTTPIISNSYLYSNDEYIFGGELNSNGGGTSSTNTRVINECTLNSFKRPINLILGNSSVWTKLQFMGNKVTVRDTTNYTYCINKSAWDATGSTTSDYSVLLCYNNISNVQLVQTHTFVNSYHVTEESNNIESSNYIAFNN